MKHEQESYPVVFDPRSGLHTNPSPSAEAEAMGEKYGDLRIRATADRQYRIQHDEKKKKGKKKAAPKKSKKPAKKK